MKLLKCSHCGNVVDMIYESGVPVVCCGEKMEELVANTTEAATEKHIPVLSVDGDVLTVKVGEVPHPMIKEHYITTIIAVLGNKVFRAHLSPEEAPEACFALGGYKGKVVVYEYCNIHGLWKAEIDV